MPICPIFYRYPNRGPFSAFFLSAALELRIGKMDEIFSLLYGCAIYDWRSPELQRFNWMKSSDASGCAHQLVLYLLFWVAPLLVGESFGWSFINLGTVCDGGVCVRFVFYVQCTLLYPR